MGKKINTPLRRLLLFCVSLCGAGMLMLLFATMLNGRETAVVYAQTLPEVYINASNTTVSEGVGTAQVQVTLERDDPTASWRWQVDGELVPTRPGVAVLDGTVVGQGDDPSEG